MSERSLIQYQPITGPVWREPVAEKLAWLPRGQQPARALEYRRVGDFQQPPFVALYVPAGLQWQPVERYVGKSLARSALNYTVFPIQFGAPAYNPVTLEWTPDGQAPQIALERRRLGDFAQPPFQALYKAEGLQWEPRGKATPTPAERRLLGDFQQPPFQSLYKPDGLQWQALDRYSGKALAKASYDWTVKPLNVVVQAYDPSTIEWVPKGQAPRVTVERRIIGDFQQPPQSALYRPDGLQWQPRGQQPRVPVERRSVGDFQQPAFVALYKPEHLQWLASDRYAGHGIPYALQARFVIDPTPIGTVYDPRSLTWMPTGIAPQVRPERRIVGDFKQPPFAALYKPEGLQWVLQGWGRPRLIHAPRKLIDEVDGFPPAPTFVLAVDGRYRTASQPERTGNAEGILRSGAAGTDYTVSAGGSLRTVVAPGPRRSYRGEKPN